MSELYLLLDLDPDLRRRAARRASGPDGLWALRSVLVLDRDARVRGAAATRLGALGGDLARRWLTFSLGDRSPQVRARALRALARCGGAAQAGPIEALLRRDPVWWVRRAAALALAALAHEAPGAIEALRQSLDDPAWRVRLGAHEGLALLASDENLDAILAPLPGAPLHAAMALDHLRAALTGATPRSSTTPGPLHGPASPLDDDDPAVAAAALARAAPGAVAPRRLIDWLTEPHAPLRAQAIERLAGRLDDATRAEILRRLSDPRIPHAAGALRALGLAPPDDPRPAEALKTDDPRDPWARVEALDLAAAGVALDDADPWVQRAAAALIERQQPDPTSRLDAARRLAHRRDPRLRIHAAALAAGAGPEAAPVASLLYGDPLQPVRAAAADALASLGADGAWALEAVARDEHTPPGARKAALTWLALRLGRPEAPVALRDHAALGAHARLLLEALGVEPGAEATRGAEAAPRSTEATQGGAERGDAERGTEAARGVERGPRMILSGRNEPPTSALEEAREAGLTRVFWEPFYRSLTLHLRRHRDLEVIAGSYHADSASIERDLDRTLRRLRRDRVEVFLLFWARSAGRLSAGAVEAMQRLKASGKVGAIGFSTHLRGLASDALGAGGWDTLMTRHSAAHRGAEPLLREASGRGVEALTFASLCYGRLLRRAPGSTTEPARAIDCYRFGLETPGVSAVITAPRSRAEIRDAIEAALHPALGEAERARLLAHGAAVHAASRHSNGLLRQAPTSQRPGVRTLVLERIEVEASAAPPAPLEGLPGGARGALSWRRPPTHER